MDTRWPAGDLSGVTLPPWPDDLGVVLQELESEPPSLRRSPSPSIRNRPPQPTLDVHRWTSVQTHRKDYACPSTVADAPAPDQRRKQRTTGHKLFLHDR